MVFLSKSIIELIPEIKGVTRVVPITCRLSCVIDELSHVEALRSRKVLMIFQIISSQLLKTNFCRTNSWFLGVSVTMCSYAVPMLCAS